MVGNTLLNAYAYLCYDFMIPETMVELNNYSQMDDDYTIVDVADNYYTY